MPDEFFKLKWELDAFEKGGKKMIGGFVSSGRKDKQAEAVLQNGLDFSHFIKSGFFNDNHDKSTAGVIGVPTKVDFRHNPKIKQKAWWAEGFLLNTKKAEDIWDIAKALKDTDRALGFSLEGNTLKRNGQKIVKAAVKNIAVTPSPINDDTSLITLSKSLSSAFCVECETRDCANCSLGTLEKALSPGTATDTDEATGGDALKKQSLEGADDDDEENLKDTHVPGDPKRDGSGPNSKNPGKRDGTGPGLGSGKCPFDKGEKTLGKALDSIMIARPEISDPRIALELAVRVLNLSKAQQEE